MKNPPWLSNLNTYLNHHFTELYRIDNPGPMILLESVSAYKVASYIEQYQQPSFSKTLLELVDKYGLDDTVVYKNAGLDRKLFSKIRSVPNYQPRKKTAFALCISLQLDAEEADSLLRSAGYTFSDSHILDLIIKYCIVHKIYDLFEINMALNQYGIDPIP